MVESLQQFIELENMEAEILELNGKTQTVSQAASSLNTSEENIIKSLVVEADENFYLVVLRGKKRADLDKIKEVLEAESVELASPKEVENVTGFSVGNVPPVGTGLDKLVDEKVVEKRTVYGGGGGRSKMLKIDPRFIVDENSVVREICEEK